MPKQFLQTIRLADPSLFNAMIVASIGLVGVIVEGAVLSLHGQTASTLSLSAILLASAISSIAGFAFSALCGAFLFNLMESPVYAVQVMIVCSIAMQLFAVASLWRSIDWRSLPPFLI